MSTSIKYKHKKDFYLLRERVMSVINKQEKRSLYKFDASFLVSYVNFSRLPDLSESKLIMTLERGCERNTFAFLDPHFNEVDRNLVCSSGVYIAMSKPSAFGQSRVEVGDLKGGFAYFTARSFYNITPTVAIA